MSWVHCKAVGSPFVGSSHFYKEMADKVDGNDWIFAGDELDHLQEGSEWWGTWVVADHGLVWTGRGTYEHPRPANVKPPWFQGKLFLGGLLIPATGSSDREFRDCLHDLGRRVFVQRRGR